MNSYEAKQAQRRARLLEKAEQAFEDRNALFARERELAEHVPLGQPILVGHHSERRHRSHLDQMNRLTRKGIEKTELAEHYIAKADAVGRGGVSADDPDAIAKLEAQQVELESYQSLMKDANRRVKKLSGKEERLALLNSLCDEDLAAFHARHGDFLGFPSYELRNNGANIRRIRGRITELRESQEAENICHEGSTFTYEEDSGENRAFFYFDGKPDEHTRSLLKSHGWRWAPSRGAWLRQLSQASRAAGRLICKQLDG